MGENAGVMSNRAGEFKIRVGNGARRVVTGDEGCGNVGWEAGAPKETVRRSSWRAKEVGPAHADPTGIRGANDKHGAGIGLADGCRPGSEVAVQPTNVVQEVVEGGVEANAWL